MYILKNYFGESEKIINDMENIYNENKKIFNY